MRHCGDGTHQALQQSRWGAHANNAAEEAGRRWGRRGVRQSSAATPRSGAAARKRRRSTLARAARPTRGRPPRCAALETISAELEAERCGCGALTYSNRNTRGSSRIKRHVRRRHVRLTTGCPQSHCAHGVRRWRPAVGPAVAVAHRAGVSRFPPSYRSEARAGRPAASLDGLSGFYVMAVGQVESGSVSAHEVCADRDSSQDNARPWDTRTLSPHRRAPLAAVSRP